MPKDLSVTMPNRAGSLAKAASAVAASGVNMVGACGFGAGNTPEIHMLVEDADVARTRNALESAGATVTREREALIVDVAHQAGGLAAAVKPIAEAGVNTDLFYITQDGRLVLGVDDMAKARAAVSQA
jgi:hypothetical protein